MVAAAILGGVAWFRRSVLPIMRCLFGFDNRMDRRNRVSQSRMGIEVAAFEGPLSARLKSIRSHVGLLPIYEA